MTEQDHRDDALLDERLHQLFGPPATIHQGGGIDWSWEQYNQAVAQLEAEGVIRPTDEVVTDPSLRPLAGLELALCRHRHRERTGPICIP